MVIEVSNINIIGVSKGYLNLTLLFLETIYYFYKLLQLYIFLKVSNFSNLP